MEVLVKTTRGLKSLGEMRVLNKKSLKLKEEVDANIGTANGIQAAQMKARQIMNKNPNVKSASADAGKLDGQKDAGSGEGMTLELPVNANGKQLAQAQRMVKDQSADDTQITFTKDDNTPSTNEGRLLELRRNSIEFTKNEMDKFLKEI